MRVRRWLSDDRTVTYVFLGESRPGSPARQKALAVLRRLEAQDSSTLSSSDREVLAAGYGPSYATVLALSRSSHRVHRVRFVQDALYLDDTVKAVLHKLAHVLRSTPGPDADVDYARLYAWATRRANPTAAAAETFVRQVFRGRITCGERELLAALQRTSRGFFSGATIAANKDKQLTSAHAAELVLSKTRDGLQTRTNALGHRLLTASGSYEAYYDVDPFRGAGADLEPRGSSGSGSGKKPAPAAEGAREEHFEGSEKAVLTDELQLYQFLRGDQEEKHEEGYSFELTTLSDIERHYARRRLTGSIAERRLYTWYFPPRTGDEGASTPEVGAFVADDQAQLLARRFIGPYATCARAAASAAPDAEGEAQQRRDLRMVRLRCLDPARAFHVGELDLEMVFNAFETGSDVPLVKLYDGATTLVRVNRMALHKDVVDVDWVARHLAHRGRAASTRPFVQFVLRAMEATDVRVTLVESGALDLVVAFPARAKGGPAAVGAAVSAANAHVVDALNQLDKGGHLSFATFDPTALELPGGASDASHTRVVDVLSEKELAVPQTGSTSVAAISSALAAYHALFGLVTRRAPESGGGVTAMYRRAALASDAMAWVVAVRALTAPGSGVSREDATGRLASLFLVDRHAAQRRLDDVLLGRYAAEQHLYATLRGHAHVPTVWVKQASVAAVRVGTASIVDAGARAAATVAVERVLLDQRPRVSSDRTVSAGDVLASDSASGARASRSKVNAADSADANTIDSTDALEADDADDADAALSANDGYGDAGFPGLDSDVLDAQLEDLLEDEQSGTTAASASDVASAASSASTPVKENERDAYILDALKSADPEVFDNKGRYPRRYATTCGAAPKRQPIVVSAEELARMDPRSYAGAALAYGSTPELAARNRYICPKVWCPVSRVALSAQQFAAAGRRCPAEADRPIVFENTYWAGGERYPGLLSSSGHPTGLCMPCCFKNFKPHIQTCDSGAGFSGAAAPEGADGAEGASAADADGPERGRADQRYIKGDTLPLEARRYGMVPPALIPVLNDGSTAQCGARPDGSGQVTSDTDCIVRRGVARSRQSFLQALAELFRVPGGAEGVASLIADHLAPDEFIAMNDGTVCRMFMDVRAAAPDDAENGLRAELRRAAFEEWFVGPRAAGYRARMGLERVAKALRAGGGKQRDAAWHSAEVQRELLIYRSWRRFVAYVRDPAIVKVHTLLLGLVNQATGWLNPRGVNVLVIERSDSAPTFQPSASASASASAASAMRVDCAGVAPVLDRPFALIVKQGPFYEPLVRITINIPRRESSGRGSLKKGGAGLPAVLPDARAPSGALVERDLLSYGSDRGVRTLVNAVLEGCAKPSVSPGLCTSAECVARFLRESAPANDIRAQVLDYTFRLVGFVTRGDVFVPLLRPEAILLGSAAPREFVYVGDLHRLRPRGSPAALAAAFERLARLSGADGYNVARATPAFLQLRSGAVVPIAMSEAALDDREHYLTNLNIMVGRQLPDDRTRYVDEVSARRRTDAAVLTAIARALERDTPRLREFAALRSAFNPFPTWYRRTRMRALLATLRQQLGSLFPSGSAARDALADALLFGPDILRRRSLVPSAAVNRRLRNLRGRAGAQTDVLLTDEEQLSGSWLARVRAVVANPFAVLAASDTARVDGRDAQLVAQVSRATLLAAGQPLLRDVCGDRRPSSSSKKPASARSAASARAAARTGLRLVPTCGIWPLFALIGRLVSPDARGIPQAAFAAVLADALMEATRTSFVPNAASTTAALSLLRVHPSLRPPSANAKTKLSQLAEQARSAMPRLLAALRSPSYVAGLLDAWVLARFFRVECEVRVSPDADHAPELRAAAMDASDVAHEKMTTKANDAASELLGAPPVVAVFGDAVSDSKRHLPRTMSVVYGPRPGTVDVVLHSQSPLFQRRTTEI